MGRGGGRRQWRFAIRRPRRDGFTARTARGRVRGSGEFCPGNGRSREAFAVDFALSAEQQHWHDTAVAFAREALNDALALLGRDERREFWRGGWQRCARFGTRGLPAPPEYGGKGADLPATIAAM